MLEILKRLKRSRWRHFIPLIPLLLSAATCDICGSTVGPGSASECDQFKLVSAKGFPYGPVLVSWTQPADLNQDLVLVNISDSNFNVLGTGVANPGDTSTTVTIDHNGADKAMALDGIFIVNAQSVVDNNYLPAICQFDSQITLQKKKKAAPSLPTATPMPPTRTPMAESQPHATLIIPPIIRRSPTPTITIPR